MVLTPGERIRLIKKITARLGREPWDEIDLALEQHGFGTSPTWEGTPQTYVLEHIKRGGDEHLAELHTYLYPDEPARDRGREAEDAAEPIWQGKDDALIPVSPRRFRLFLSHTSANKVLMRKLQASLTSHAIKAFVAHEDIMPTKEWEDEIQTALLTCDALAAYLTPDFHGSDWTDQEVGVAVGRGVLIVPIKAGLDPYGFIAKYQALSAHADVHKLAGALHDVLSTHEATRVRIAEATVNRFLASYSFNDARAQLNRLRSIRPEVWTPELLDLIEANVDANGELTGANVGFGEAAPTVAEKARALVAELRTAAPSPAR